MLLLELCCSSCATNETTTSRDACIVECVCFASSVLSDTSDSDERMVFLFNVLHGVYFRGTPMAAAAATSSSTTTMTTTTSTSTTTMTAATSAAGQHCESHARRSCVCAVCDVSLGALLSVRTRRRLTNPIGWRHLDW